MGVGEEVEVEEVEEGFGRASRSSLYWKNWIRELDSWFAPEALITVARGFDLWLVAGWVLVGEGVVTKTAMRARLRCLLSAADRNDITRGDP